MAGIGFELKRVIDKGGIGGFLKAALSGIMIVAGPWILSILSIYLTRWVTVYWAAEGRAVFTSVIVYSYAFSLILFGGFHFIYTRILADLLYRKKWMMTGSVFVLFMFIILVITLFLGSLLGFFSSFGMGEYRLLYIVSVVLFFVSINLIWIVMLFISMLQWYGKILLIYLGGMICGIGLLYLFSRWWGFSGGLLGFASGHIIIVLALTALSVKAYPPGPFGLGRNFILPYMKRYRKLFWTGTLYNVGIWIDKIILWAWFGTSAGFSFFRLNEAYDICVYFANLTLIPGLVFFVISMEPAVYIRLRTFLLSMQHSTLRQIRRAKYRMIGDIKRKLREQLFFQLLFTLCAVILAPVILGHVLPGVTRSVLYFSLSAVFFHFMLLTILNLHFYLEFYSYSQVSALLFASVNCLVTLLLALTGRFDLAGLGYCAGGVCASAAALHLFFRGVKKAERYIISGFRV